jgi:hypothetical protein
MKRFYAFVLFALSMLACNASGQWESEDFAADNAALKKGEKMGSPVTAGDYGGSLPLASIQCPNDGDNAVGADIRVPVAALLAEVDDIRNNAVTGLANKVDRTGDTMTDTLTVNASGSNAYAVRANGTGSGGGVRGVGGNSSGPGGVFLGGTNGNAIEATGDGIGFAAVLGGTASTATAPTRTLQVQSGGIQLTATSPNANVDPGANHTIWPQSITSSSCTIDTDGAGGVTVQTAGFNINTATIFGLNTLVVTFKRTLPGTTYRVALGEYGPYKAELVNGSRTATGYELKVRDLATNTYVNLTTTSVTVFVTTTGF